MWKIRYNIEDEEDLLMLGAGYIYLQKKKVLTKDFFG